MNPTLTPDDLDAIERHLENITPGQTLMTPTTLRELMRLARSALSTPALAPQPSSEAGDDPDEAYEIGKRDGYSEAVQDIDRLTGGDGEYRYVMGGDPDRHTPDPETMKQRIADRFNDLSQPSSDDAWDGDVTTEGVQIMRDKAAPYLAGAELEQIDPPQPSSASVGGVSDDG